MKNISNAIAKMLEENGTHIESHVTILKGLMPEGERLTLKIESPKRHWLDDEYSVKAKPETPERRNARSTATRKIN